MTTAEVDNVLFEKWARAHLQYCGTKAFKLIQLLGTSACKGSWSVRMSAFCFQAGNDLNARLTQAEVRVIKELYERITTVRKENITRDRTAEEINNTMTFWWKLQRYREYWLEMNRRKDTAAVILTDKEVAEVKRLWGDREVWYNLREDQKEKHLPSMNNAALNNQTGWSKAGTAIIRRRLPRLRAPEDPASATEHAETVGDFAHEMVEWLTEFAKSLTEYWKTPGYKRAREQSDTPTTTWGDRYEARWRGHLVHGYSRANEHGCRREAPN
jgi:hypothetical protein